MAVTEKQKVRFGPFVLDVHSGELHKNGFRLKVQPQPIQVLTILLEQPGELVTREEIRTRIWPSDTFVDFEHGLNTAVKKLRQALGDESETPKYIETLPRRGYRFIDKLDSELGYSPSPAEFNGVRLRIDQHPLSRRREDLHTSNRATALPEPAISVRPYARWLALLLCLVVIAALIFPIWKRNGLKSNSSPQPALSSIAQDSYTESQILLERRDRPGNIDRAISLLDTALRQEPDFALASTALGEAYWYRYVLSRDPAALEKAETFAKRAVAMNSRLPDVHVTLGRIEAERNRRELALQEMQQALRLDPHNPKAFRGLGAIYSQMDRPEEADRAYQEAIRLAPNAWIGYNDYGNFFFDHRNFEAAAQQFQRALETATDNAIVHSNLALALQELGALQLAEFEFKRSIDLDPSYRGYTMLGRLYYTQRRWAEAAATIEKALPLNDSDYRLWANLALAYEWQNDEDKASKAFNKELSLLQEAFRLKPEDPEIICELGALYARQHNRAKAIPLLEKALTLRPRDPSIHHNSAEGFEHLGERSRAIELLQKALELGLPRANIERNPAMRKLCHDPAYLRLFAANSSKARV
jgi:tetratricopeptide (TPR) repeat protein/DNA-binding winged helix-turn-helix (wHTH) protein